MELTEPMKKVIIWREWQEILKKNPERFWWLIHGGYKINIVNGRTFIQCYN